MAKNVNYVSHKKSKLKNQDGTPQLPSASVLVEGEIAINFAENVETLSIKNESGHVVTFSSDNYYTEKKLGSGFTGANSANTVTKVIVENEKVISMALNDLNERKLDASAYTPTDLSNYYTKTELTGSSTTVVVAKASSATTASKLNNTSAVGSGTQPVFFTENGVPSATTYSLSKSVPSNAVFTDVKATQTNTTTNGTYEVLLAGSTATATTTEGASKNVGLSYNPSTSALTASKKISTLTFNNIITGTGTVGYSGTTQSPNYMPSKWTFNKGITTPAHGDIFTIQIPCAGAGPGVYMSLNNGGNYYPIICSGNSKLTTHFGSGITLTVIYESGTTAASIWPVTGGTSTSSGTSAAGVFRVLNYRDTTYGAMSAAEISAGTATTQRVMTAANLKTGLDKVYAPLSHTASTGHMNSTEKTNLDSLATNIAAISGITSTKVSNWNTAYTNNHTHSNKSTLDAITATSTAINSLTGSVGTMAFQNTSSYSSATQVNTALSGKAIVKELTTEDLDTVKTPGFYNAGGSNTCANKPSAVTSTISFGMQVIHCASGDYYEQIYFVTGSNDIYTRYCSSGTWGTWVRLDSKMAFYGTCSTAASERVKVVSLSNTTGWELRKGVIVGVKFTNSNTFSASTTAGFPTLNVNNTGDKPIYYNTTTANTGVNTMAYGAANRVGFYMYDGTNWVWLSSGYEATYSTMSAAELSGGTATSQRVMSAVNTINGLKAYGFAKSIVSAMTISANQSNVTCPSTITGSTNSGAQATVVYSNGGTTTDYTVTVSTSYKTPDGNQLSLKCPKGGYCEVNYLNIGGTIYARGL